MRQTTIGIQDCRYIRNPEISVLAQLLVKRGNRTLNRGKSIIALYFSVDSRSSQFFQHFFPLLLRSDETSLVDRDPRATQLITVNFQVFDQTI